MSPANPDAAPDLDAPTTYRRSLLRQERSRATRDRLVRAALDLWRAQGYVQTTVDEIAARADVSTSTFYFHFANKDSMLLELGRLTARRVEDDAPAEPAGPVDVDVLAFVRSLTHRVGSVPREVVAAVVTANIANIAHLGDVSNSEHDTFAATLYRILVPAQERGELRDGIDLNEVAAIMTATMLEGTLRWAKRSDQADLEDWLLLRAQILLHGITAPPR